MRNRMKKYKTIPLNYEISIDNEEEEASAKEILRQKGGCYSISCFECPFHYEDSYACMVSCHKERVKILKSMRVEL